MGFAVVPKIKSQNAIHDLGQMFVIAKCSSKPKRRCRSYNGLDSLKTLPFRTQPLATIFVCLTSLVLQVLLWNNEMFYVTAELQVTRLNDGKPIMTQEIFDAVDATDDGYNINGPCVIRVPDWVDPKDKAHPSAKYYMYFGHHSGLYIRLAWAGNNIEGPWTLFNIGTNDDPRVKGRGVFDIGVPRSVSFPNGGALIQQHIASPDVIVDDENKRFIMYFHGVSNSLGGGDTYFDTGSQSTVVATSSTGINFNNPDSEGVLGGVGGGEEGHGMKNALLGNAYFRTFTYNGGLYAFSNTGPIWKAPNPSVPWETSNPMIEAWKEAQPPDRNPIYADLRDMYDPFGARAEAGNSDPQVGSPRHFATHLKEDGKTLEVWYTCKGDKPERIFYTTIDLEWGGLDWDTWDSRITSSETVHTEMLRPEMEWEGAYRPYLISESGYQSQVNQLRDPYVFQDTDGSRYLFYSGSGEDAIGLAKIEDVDLPEVEDTRPRPLPIASIVSDDYEDNHIPDYAIDGDLGTWWSSPVVGENLTIELDNVYSLRFVRVATLFGERRQSYFELYCSHDDTANDEDWDFLGSFKTTGNSKDLEAFVFPITSGARFIRFVCTGNNEDNYNIFLELEVWGTPVVPSPVDESLGDLVDSVDPETPGKLSIVNVTTTDAEEGYPGSNTIDGSLETRWSTRVYGASITLELEGSDEVVITDIQVAVLYGMWRVTYFRLETSLDGVKWKSLGGLFDTQLGTDEVHSVLHRDIEVEAKFVRITGYGNSADSGWTSIKEIELYGYKKASFKQPDLIVVDTDTSLEKLSVSNVITSNAQEGYPGSNAIDGKLETRWSSRVYGASIVLQLEGLDSAVIKDIKVAVLRGSWRVTYLDVETSMDGINWMFLSDGPFHTKPGTDDLQSLLGDVQIDRAARFVKLIGYGNSAGNGWTSITEIELYGYTMAC